MKTMWNNYLLWDGSNVMFWRGLNWNSVSTRSGEFYVTLSAPFWMAVLRPRGADRLHIPHTTRGSSTVTQMVTPNIPPSLLGTPPAWRKHAELSEEGRPERVGAALRFSPPSRQTTMSRVQEHLKNGNTVFLKSMARADPPSHWTSTKHEKIR